MAKTVPTRTTTAPPSAPISLAPKLADRPAAPEVVAASTLCDPVGFTLLAVLELAVELEVEDALADELVDEVDELVELLAPLMFGALPAMVMFDTEPVESTAFW